MKYPCVGHGGSEKSNIRSNKKIKKLHLAEQIMLKLIRKGLIMSSEIFIKEKSVLRQSVQPG